MLLLRDVAILVLLGVITYTDLKRTEIDDEPLVLLLGFGVFFSLAGFSDVSVKSSVWGFFIGGGVFYGLAVIFGTMGGGDIKLMAALGFLLGTVRTVFAISLSFLFGAAISLLVMLLLRKGLKDFMPLGPAIALGAVATLVLSWTI